MEERKTIDMLTKDGVSILTQRIITIGEETFPLDNHRIAYSNSEMGRKDLINEQPENIVAAIMTIWGDSPTVVIDVELDNPE